LDSATLEDWGKEMFPEGVGVKWKKWVRGRGRGRKNFKCPTPSSPLH